MDRIYYLVRLLHRSLSHAEYHFRLLIGKAGAVMVLFGESRGGLQTAGSLLFPQPLCWDDDGANGISDMQ